MFLTTGMAGVQMSSEPAGQVGAGCQVSGSGDSWGFWEKGSVVWLRAQSSNYALMGIEYQCCHFLTCNFGQRDKIVLKIVIIEA